MVLLTPTAKEIQKLGDAEKSMSTVDMVVLMPFGFIAVDTQSRSVSLLIRYHGYQRQHVLRVTQLIP